VIGGPVAIADGSYQLDPLGSFDFCLEPTKISEQAVGFRVGYLFGKSDRAAPELVQLPGKTLKRGLLAEQSPTPIRGPVALPLGKVDACSLLAEDFVAGQLGVAATKAPTPSKHYCGWNSYGGPGNVDLAFTVDLPAEGETGSTQETLGNRLSTVEPEPDKGRYVETVVGPDWAAGDDDGMQLAAIDVTDAAGKDPCTVARALAAEAWPKLPKTS
jgi:hypothetical protein